MATWVISWGWNLMIVVHFTNSPLVNLSKVKTTNSVVWQKVSAQKWRNEIACPMAFPLFSASIFVMVIRSETKRTNGFGSIVRNRWTFSMMRDGKQIITRTSMHSSGGRCLSRRYLPRGYMPRERYVHRGGLSRGCLPSQGRASRGCLLTGGVCPGGVCKGPVYPSMQWGRTPPPRKQNDRQVKNITLPQTSFAGRKSNNQWQELSDEQLRK